MPHAVMGGEVLNNLCVYMCGKSDVHEKVYDSIQKEIKNLKNANVPIHSFKCRRKTLESSFLKMKKKGLKCPEEILDFIGVRILCMLEEDVRTVHFALIDELPKNNYAIKEIKVYGWNDVTNGKYTYKDFEKALSHSKSAVLQDKEFTFTRSEKISGYSSVHYIVVNDYGVPIEIQLRTVFQDVWAELEHYFVYKSREIHPQIRNTFNILADELKAKDAMLSHMRDVVNNEEKKQRYSNMRAAPRGYFVPDDEFGSVEHKMERAKKQDPWDRFRRRYKKYASSVMSQRRLEPSAEAWVKDASINLQELHKCVPRLPKEDMEDPALEKAISFFFNFESAYLALADAKYEKALDAYAKMDGDDTSTYATYFRRGEIALLNGNEATALSEFDLCESSMEKTQTVRPLNKFRVYLYLSHIYAYIGEEYIDSAVISIDKAYGVYKKSFRNLDIQGGEVFRYNMNDKLQMYNNLCWIYTMKYIYLYQNFALGLDPQRKVKAEDTAIDQEKREAARLGVEDAYEKAKKWYLVLLEKNDERYMFANIYDTMAWFCYQSYLFEKKKYKSLVGEGFDVNDLRREKYKKWISDAYAHSKKIQVSQEYASHNVVSMNIHMNHLHAICSAYEKEECSPNACDISERLELVRMRLIDKECLDAFRTRHKD